VERPVVARCRFYRRKAAAGGHIYEQIGIDGPNLHSCLVTAHPPPVGDRICLTDRNTGDSGIYLVRERCWSYPDYGSAAWPIGKTPDAPLVEIIVESAEGLFRDEVEAYLPAGAPV